VFGRLAVGALATGFGVLAQTVPANSQQAPLDGNSLVGSSDAKNPEAKHPGAGGILIGEGIYLKAGVTAEAGYDTNVFYNDQSRVDSGTLQVTPFAEINNSAREGGGPPFQYSIGASLLYREYLNEDAQVRAQRAFNPAFTAALNYKGGAQTLGISDQFSRVQDAPYERGSEPITRNYNIASLYAGLSPGGGRIKITPRYTNTLDAFDGSELSFGNRMSHHGNVDLSWKWLPKTAVYFLANVGYVHYFDSQAAAKGKHDSIPYRLMGGLRGLVTSKLTISLGVGWADAHYQGEGVNPAGASNLALEAGFTFNPRPLTSTAISYVHEFRDSPILGTYYDVDGVNFSVGQKVGPFQLGAGGNYEFRRYHGNFMGTALLRRDHVLQSRVALDYQVQKWFFVGVGYTNMISRSNSGDGLTAVGVPQADFTKHMILGRVSVTY
jgi:hypothetical protein